MGVAFRDEVWRVLELLVLNPELGPDAHRDFRRVLTRRFPYVLYYRLTADTIEIRACLHHRQNQHGRLRRA